MHISNKGHLHAASASASGAYIYRTIYRHRPIYIGPSPGPIYIVHIAGRT
jgi:hypothetical protein